jgi:hypothetical protein
MDAIHEGKQQVVDICTDQNYPGPGSDEFSLLLTTYNLLKKKELEGGLPKYEPAFTGDEFTLSHYIKQKIWWHSGPDKIFYQEEEIKFLSNTLIVQSNALAEQRAKHDLEIEKLKVAINQIELEYSEKINAISKSSKRGFLFGIFGITVGFALLISYIK